MKSNNIIFFVFHSKLSSWCISSRLILTLFYLFPPLNFKLPENRIQLVLSNTQSPVQCSLFDKPEKIPGDSPGKENKKKPGFALGFSCSSWFDWTDTHTIKQLVTTPTNQPHVESPCSKGLLWSTVSFFSAVVSGVLISIGTAECSSGLSRHLQLDRNKTMTTRRKIFGL